MARAVRARASHYQGTPAARGSSRVALSEPERQARAALGARARIHLFPQREVIGVRHVRRQHLTGRRRRGDDRVIVVAQRVIERLVG